MPARTQSEVIDEISEQSRVALLDQENQDVDQLLVAYRQAQTDIVAKMNAIFEAMVDTGDGWQLDYMETTGKLKALLDDVNMRIAQLNQVAADQVEAAKMTQYQGARLHTTYMVDQATPPGVPVAMPAVPVEAVRALVNEPYEGAMFSQRIGMINDAMASDIRDQLVQSMINGEDMRATARRVRGVIGADQEEAGGFANRAETIARTEIMRAQNLGRDSIYSHNQDLMSGTPVWEATGDGRICPWCLRRDGMTQAQIKAKKQGDDPFGNKATAPLHPRCRCTLRPQLKSWKALGVDMPEGWDPEMRGMRDEETGKWVIADVKDFKAWKTERLGTS